MAIRDWPEPERPRERLLAKGAHNLSDAELLAICLRTGNRDLSALELARHLIQTYGDITQLFHTDRPTFCRTPGLGTVKYIELQAIKELGKRYYTNELSTGTTLTQTEQAQDYFRYHLKHQQREVFSVLFLDNKHRVIQYREMFQGSLSESQVYPREVAKMALQLNAAALIVGHNHPSGDIEPSADDIQVTDQLKQALNTISVRLLDHFIVGNNEVYSLVEHGHLLPFEGN